MFDDLGLGRIDTGTYDRFTGPRIHQSEKRPVVFMTGGAGTAATGFTDAAPVLNALVNRGHIVGMPSVPLLWGNATAKTRIGTTITQLVSTWGQNDQAAIIVGQSNGAACALLYAAANPSKVAGLVLIVPPLDVDYIYANDILSLQAGIGAAWSTTPPADLPAGANPMEQAGSITAPIYLAYASDDAVTIAGGDGLSRFATALGHSPTVTQNLGALGHTSAAVQAVDASAVASFCAAL